MDEEEIKKHMVKLFSWLYSSEDTEIRPYPLTGLFPNIDDG